MIQGGLNYYPRRVDGKPGDVLKRLLKPRLSHTARYEWLGPGGTQQVTGSIARLDTERSPLRSHPLSQEGR